MKYLRSTKLSCKDIGISKSEFVTETQFLFIKISNKYKIQVWDADIVNPATANNYVNNVTSGEL